MATRHPATLPVISAQVALALQTYQREEKHFAYDQYPGFHFGKTKPLFEDRRVRSSECEFAEMTDSDESVVLRKCNSCICMKKRSESFYDIFLASSVKTSDEFEQLQRTREEEKLKHNRQSDNNEMTKYVEHEDDNDISNTSKDSGVIIQPSYSQTFNDDVPDTNQFFQFSSHDRNLSSRRESNQNDLSIESFDDLLNDESVEHVKLDNTLEILQPLYV